MINKITIRIVMPLAVAVGFLVATLLVPASAGAWSKPSASQPNIVQTAVADPQRRFDTLAQALTCTDLAGVLQSKWLNFTVFAPTDEAFGKINLNEGNVCKIPKAQLRNILLYHVNLGSKDASQVLARKNLLMLNFKWAPINASVPSIANQKIIATDVRTSNGIIHVIDGVMIP